MIFINNDRNIKYNNSTSNSQDVALRAFSFLFLDLWFSCLNKIR